ncbi:hypothetical protein ACOME3_010621 [Neoechinorhynchus agilis]
MGSHQCTASEPTPKLISMLSKTTHCSERTVRESYERFKTYAPSGIMDKETFINRFQTKHPNVDVNTVANVVFKYFDTDSSGGVGFAEYFLPNAFTTAVDPKERAEILFDIFDSDDNNTVSDKELRIMIKGLNELRGNCLSRAEINSMTSEIVQQMDCDGDRKIGEEEFIHAILHCERLRNLLTFNFSNY